MNTLFQLRFASQHCLYAAGDVEAQEQERKDCVCKSEVKEAGSKRDTFWYPYEDHTYARPPPDLHGDSTPCDVAPVTSGVTTQSDDHGLWEGSVTRCICEFKHDDGYMICCDRCGVWQHVDCMGVKRSNIPDVYLCELCEPRFVDKHSAIRLQTKKREILQEVGNLVDPDSEGGKRRPPKKGAGRRRQPRRRTVSTSRNKNQKPDRLVTYPPDASPGSLNSPTKRRHSAQLAKTVELTVTPQPPTLGSTGHLGRPDNSAPGPNCNNYSSEFRLYVEELQVMNLLERISSPGLSFSSREICAVFQATPESKGIKAEAAIEAGRAIVEYSGHVMTQPEYSNNSGKSGRFVLFYRNLGPGLSVCVEGSDSDAIGRFVRRSTDPNAEVRHYFDGSGAVRFFIWSVKNICRGCEITIPFDQDVDASSPKIPNDVCSVDESKLSSPQKLRVGGRKSLKESIAVASSPTKSTKKLPPRVKKHRRCSATLQLASGAESMMLDSCAAPVTNRDRIPSVEHPVGGRNRGVANSTEQQGPLDDSERKVDPNRKLTREEKKLEAIMKAFERIQREGPLRRSREKNPTRQASRRRRSTKSESTDSKEASEDCSRNEDENTEKRLTPVDEENQSEAKIDEDIEDISKDNMQIETAGLHQNEFFNQPVKCEGKEEKKEEVEEVDVKTSVKNTDDMSSERVDGVETGVKVEELENDLENGASELDAGKISSTFEEKSKNLKEDVEKNEDSSFKSKDTERKIEEDLEHSAANEVHDEELKSDNPGESEAGAEANAGGANEDTVLRPRRSRRVRHLLKASSTRTQYPESSRKEIQSSPGGNAGNSVAENDAVPDNSSAETKAEEALAGARPKGRPRRVTSKGHGVRENLEGERKSEKGSFEDRVRTRSSTRDENGATLNKFGKHYELTGDKRKKKTSSQKLSVLKSKGSSRQKSSMSRARFSKGGRKLLQNRNSGRIRTRAARVPPLSKDAQPQSTEQPDNRLATDETTALSHAKILDMNEPFVGRKPMLLRPSLNSKVVTVESLDWTSSESDLENMRGMSSPTEVLSASTGTGPYASRISPCSLSDSIVNQGSAKKRWLRQAIIESTEPLQQTTFEQPSATTETTLSPAATVAISTPLKKRRVTLEAESCAGFPSAMRLTWSDDAKMMSFPLNGEGGGGGQLPIPSSSEVERPGSKMPEVSPIGFGVGCPVSWPLSGLVSSSVADRTATGGMSEDGLIAAEDADREPECGESVEPASSTSGFEARGGNAPNKREIVSFEMVWENVGATKESEAAVEKDLEANWPSSEHEVSTSVVDEHDSTDRPVLQICSSPSDQTVTCSSCVEEKEDGEITDDDLENSDGDRGMTGSSSDNLWNCEAVPTGGKLCQGNTVPVKRGSPVDKVERDVVLGDARILEPNRGAEDLVSRPMTPVDEGGAKANCRSPYFKEPMLAERLRSEFLEKGQRSTENFIPNERRTRDLSPLSSSDSEGQPVSQSNQLGAKRKMSLVEYRKRMKRKRKADVVDNDLPTVATRDSAAAATVVTDLDHHLEIKKFDKAACTIRHFNSGVTVGSTMPAKTLSLTERLRFEFGVDASDETDAQQDERDDDEPPPPPPPPPPPRVSLPAFQLPKALEHPPLPSSPEPPPPPPPDDDIDDEPIPPPPLPSRPWPKLEKLVGGIAAVLSAQSKLESFHPIPGSRFSPLLPPATEDRNHSAPGSSALRGVQPPHLRNFSGFSRQQSEPCGEATAGKVSAAVRCPTSGVRVEHFASVKRQTPQPIVPLMHRFTRRSPRGNSAIGTACRRDFSYVPDAPKAEDDRELGLPGGPQKNRSIDSLGHSTGLKRPRGKPLLPLPSELPAQLIHGAVTGLTRNNEIFDNSMIQNRKGFPKDFGKGNAHALTECLASRQWNSSSSDNSERASEQSSARTDEQRRDRGRCSSRLSSASDTGRGGGHLRRTSRKSWDSVGELGSWRDEDPDVPLNDRVEGGDAGGRKVFPLMSIRSFPLMKSFDVGSVGSVSASFDHSSQTQEAASWIDVSQSDHTLTPSSANSESTNHEQPPASAHDTAHFPDDALERRDPGQSSGRTPGRAASRNEFIRSLERNRACQAILQRQMSDSL